MQARNPNLPTEDAEAPRPDDAPFSLEHPQVIAALEEYMDALGSGRRVDRKAFLDRFPDIGRELNDCLDGLELLHSSADVEQNGKPKKGQVGVGDEMPALPLGDFRLLREIGRGGMGVVYEAEQLSLGRRVALKVLPFAATLDPRQLQRFKHEAQAAACLHHPNIVPVYAVGCDRGVHYYAMQFIEGQTVAAAILQLREQRGLPTEHDIPSSDHASTNGTQAQNGSSASAELRPLPSSGRNRPAAAETYLSVVTERSRKDSEFFRHVAQLGMRVAEALDHAHQFGVVHRDIKPANLLLDQQGDVWITDFGLARLETSAGVTMTGDLVGTLRYMSPEQALARRGMIDHRTDIYSLGVTLYELLTLEPAFGGQDRHEVLRKIASEEPRRPRQVNKNIPADLETILLKSIAKNPAERYATAQELAADLRCFLDDQPIHARRPSLMTRAAKWAKRHRTLVAAGLVLLVLTTIGLAISNYYIYREQEKTRQAYEAEARAYHAETKQRALTEENFKQARGMLDFFTQVMDEDLAGLADTQPVRRKLLEKSLAYYQDFINRSADNPRLQKELSNSHFRVAKILEEIGEEKKALDQLAAALESQHRLVRNNPHDPTLQANLKTMWQHWGTMKSSGRIRLLGEEAVQNELMLTPEQGLEVNTLVDQHREFFMKLQDFSNRDRLTLMQEFENLTVSISEQLDALLTEAQQKRFDQIRVQLRGIFAFKDPEILGKLGLSDAQSKQVERLTEAYSRLQWPRRSRGDDNRQKAVSTVVDLLTDEQKEMWDGIIGSPFTGEVRIGFPSFGPRPFGSPPTGRPKS